MIDPIEIFTSIYQKTQNFGSLLDKLKISSLTRYTIRIISNIILPIYFKFTRKDALNSEFNNSTSEEPQIIVSFTTFPARINRVWLMVESLLRQTQKPDRIILYLSKDQFPEQSRIPKSLLKLQKYGLEIHFVDGDIRPHKKYYYSLSKYPNNYIITVDDDIFYKKDLIKNLMKIHRKYPDCIISNSGSIIELDQDNKILPYSSWKKAYPNSINRNNFLIGFGGVLYPPHSLHPMATNLDLFMELCPTTDDIWLNIMAYLNKTKIYVANNKIMLPILNLHPQNLHSINLNKNINDINIDNIIKYFASNYNINPFRH